MDYNWNYCASQFVTDEIKIYNAKFLPTFEKYTLMFLFKFVFVYTAVCMQQCIYDARKNKRRLQTLDKHK